MPGFSRGYTLIELMTTLAVVGVLAMIGVPAFTHTVDGQRVGSTSRNLRASLALARHAAISQRYPVLVESIGGNWEAGWVVYIDANSNAVLDDGERELLRQGSAPGGVQITPNSPVNSYVRYVATGEAQLTSGAFQAGTFKICHENGQHDVRRLVLSASGRVRSAKDSPGTC
ncbi:type IV fimbrial biogenesis protein FimT [Azotobacter beijerinckii]|uniref:Type II secretion system protein H n=1 Tax=Azotobacter beijerinckii TaxID=170623 RepID=A0A1H9JFU6_9GAMM|nr:GspH/FimT family pseudopilin [Azotobacter beijerinckii]SEQ85700.1 type IV fimbrial biogenesis protein FimT [Azotobacter beijerinckii]